MPRVFDLGAAVLSAAVSPPSPYDVEPKLISVLLENLPGPEAPANGPLAIIPPLKFLSLAKIFAKLYLLGFFDLNDRQLTGVSHLLKHL
jgi:hypothetical protein